jgi:hypothetical protein
MAVVYTIAPSRALLLRLAGGQPGSLDTDSLVSDSLFSDRLDSDSLDWDSLDSDSLVSDKLDSDRLDSDSLDSNTYFVHVFESENRRHHVYGASAFTSRAIRRAFKIRCCVDAPSLYRDPALPRRHAASGCVGAAAGRVTLKLSPCTARVEGGAQSLYTIMSQGPH